MPRIIGVPGMSADAPTPRRALTVAAIVETATDIVDREGVDAVSMRRVAAEFGTGPASLYAHVANKEELLQLVHDHIVAGLTVPVAETWQGEVRAFGHALRNVYRQHNDAARLSFGFIPSSGAALDVMERLFATMIGGGVPPRVAGWAMDTLSLFVAADAYEGWLFGRRFTDGTGRDPQEVGHDYFAGVAETYAKLPPDRYPVLLGNLTAIMGGDDDQRFTFGLDMFIAGIAAQVPVERG